MANAVEMLSGEKNRLPLRLCSWPYSSMADALLPSTPAPWSAVADGAVSATHPATDRTKHVMSNDISGFMPYCELHIQGSKEQTNRASTRIAGKDPASRQFDLSQPSF